MSNDFVFDDDDLAKEAGAGANRKFKEFDCPECHAHNPVGDTFTDGDEVLCNYCGCEFKVSISQEGRVKFKQL
jgi:transcription elongation factor Elf1